MTESKRRHENMYFAVAYSVDLESEPINRLRRKYDPTEPIVGPHIAVVFPVPEAVGKQNFIRHIEGVLKSWKPLPIRIRGFRESFDHWLFLTLEEGYDDVVRLYRELNTGVLEKYRRDDIEFIPHIGLGLFETGTKELDEPRYRAALLEAQEANLDFNRVVDRLHLMRIPTVVIDWHIGKVARLPEGARVEWDEEFLLSGEVESRRSVGLEEGTKR